MTLPRDLRPVLNDAIAAHIGPNITLARERPIGGGCTSDATLIELTNGDSFFLKFSPARFAPMYEIEMESLNAMAAVGEIHVPRPIATGQSARHAMLLTEMVQVGKRSDDFFERFGHALAMFHRQSQQSQRRYGWHRDNYLGASIQPNDYADSWTTFFTEHRIAYQLSLSEQNSGDTGELQRLGCQLIDRLDQVLASGEGELPVLLHGDLWTGNYLCNRNGAATLIDPAVYYGHREAEFGMLRLFGACPESFYSAYHDAWPLADGWRERSEVYRLYHLLNHLNLFGNSYLQNCISSMRGILAGT